MGRASCVAVRGLPITRGDEKKAGRMHTGIRTILLAQLPILFIQYLFQAWGAKTRKTRQIHERPVLYRTREHIIAQVLTRVYVHLPKFFMEDARWRIQGDGKR